MIETPADYRSFVFLSNKTSVCSLSLGFPEFYTKKKEATETYFQQHSLLQIKHTTLVTQSLSTLAPLLNTTTLASQKNCDPVPLRAIFSRKNTKPQKKYNRIGIYFDAEFPIIILYKNYNLNS